MISIYVVKTGEQFLSTGEDGDVGMAPAIENATSFLSDEEAEKAANEYADPGYEIVAVSVAGVILAVVAGCVATVAMLSSSSRAVR